MVWHVWHSDVKLVGGPEQQTFSGSVFSSPIQKVFKFWQEIDCPVGDY